MLKLPFKIYDNLYYVDPEIFNYDVKPPDDAKEMEYDLFRDFKMSKVETKMGLFVKKTIIENLKA